jgi:signal recognition particle GTPase
MFGRLTRQDPPERMRVAHSGETRNGSVGGEGKTRMYVRRIGFENFRCFAKASTSLNVPGDGDDGAPVPNVTVLVGTNGSGKSTLLRGLAPALSASHRVALLAGLTALVRAAERAVLRKEPKS